MKRILSIILVLVIMVGTGGCTNNIVSNEPMYTNDPQIDLSIYEEIVEYISENGSAYITNNDINNPNKVEYYYLNSEKEIGDYSCSEALIAFPLEEENPTIIFTFFKHNVECSPDYSDLYPGKEYIKLDTEITLAYSLSTGIIDAMWEETLYTSDTKSDYGFEYYSTGAYGEVLGIVATEYSPDMDFPDITSFSEENWANIDNSTIRKELLSVLNIAINDMVLMVQDCGLEPDQIGFNSFTPVRNAVVSQSDLLEQVKQNIIDEYPQYVIDCEHNDHNQLYVFVSEESGFNHDIHTSNNAELKEKWSGFKTDCLTVFFNSIPNTAFIKDAAFDWQIIFFDIEGETIGYYSYDPSFAHILQWNSNIKNWEEADFKLN